MKNKYIALFIFVFVCSTAAIAQELKCNVQINSTQIQGTNKSVFNTLQTSISEFMNNRRWTNMTYTNVEKIDCSINIIIKSVDGDSYSGEIIVQSRRPVYGSSYTSPLFNFRDQSLMFNYKEFEQLEMNENTLMSNLTAILAYYAYIIIGYDMDSYARLGGTSYFQAAENIVNMAQSSEWTGWKAFENDRNRYALVNNLMDEAFKKYRNFFYEYHRLGLDEMSTTIANARARITAGLPILRETNRARSSSVAISVFMDTKTDELINIFSKATDEEKTSMVEILSDVNPTQTARYEGVYKTR